MCPRILIFTIPACVQGVIISQPSWGNRLLSYLFSSPLSPHHIFFHIAASVTFLEKLKFWCLLATFLSQTPPLSETILRLAGIWVSSRCALHTLFKHPWFLLSHGLVTIYLCFYSSSGIWGHKGQQLFSSTFSLEPNIVPRTLCTFSRCLLMREHKAIHHQSPLTRLQLV